jgi:hypothetical protein
LDGICLPSIDPSLGSAKGCITYNATSMIRAFVIYM